MRRKSLAFLLAAMLCCVSVGFAACGGEEDSSSIAQTSTVQSGSENSVHSASEESSVANSSGNDSSESSAQAARLDTPTVTIDVNGLATWTEITGASGYKCKLNDGLEIPLDGRSIQLSDGQSLQVKAVGNGTTYTDSDYSAAQTYVAIASLATPAVTIDGNGLASWQTVPNALAYKYILNGGQEQVTTLCSIQLTNGQSLQVKAIGDGTTVADSAYSVLQTYAAGSSTVTVQEPDYLGIFGSTTQPVQADGIPSELLSGSRALARQRSAGSSRGLDEALTEYYQEEANRLGDAMPTASDYTIYSAAGQTVYIQIWLNNPKQHTILSMKLNGTKYQVSGGLSSFFIEREGEHYNCVYVAVQIPAETYDCISYKVSDIEYVDGVYVNGDGTDEFMNENDTLAIGLPYTSNSMQVTNYEQTLLTVRRYEATITVADAQDLLTKSGGWLRAVVYDGYNVVGHQRVVVGQNQVSAEGLEEDCFYSTYVLLYADLHDGRGVCAHIVGGTYFATEQELEVNAFEGGSTYLDAQDKWKGCVTVRTSLKSSTSEYIKLEILASDETTVVYTNEEYNGSDVVTEGILCGANYYARIYYKDETYPNGKYRQEYTYVNALASNEFANENDYALYDDLVYSFTLGSGTGYGYVQDITFNVYDTDLSQWIAEEVLALWENPDLITQLTSERNDVEQQILAIDWNNDPDAQSKYQTLWSRYEALTERIEALENAQSRLEYDFADKETYDEAFWQAEAAKGKYLYTLTYTRDNHSQIRKIGERYYVVLEDYFELSPVRMKVVAHIDYDDGRGLQEYTQTRTMYVDSPFDGSAFGKTTIQDLTFDGENVEFRLENTETDWLTVRQGYVWELRLVENDFNSGWILYKANDARLEIDEEAWLAEYFERIEQGASVGSLASKYAGAYETSYSIPVDISSLNLKGGRYSLYAFPRLYKGEYNGDEDYDWNRQVIFEYIHYKPYAAPEILFDGTSANFTVAETDGWGYTIYVNVKDKDGNPVASNLATDMQYRGLQVGYQIQAQAKPSTGTVGWQDSEWSEWKTYYGIPISMPELSVDEGARRVVISSNGYYGNGTSIAGYEYTLNGGAVQTIENIYDAYVGVESGDVVRVRALVQNDETQYCDSEWSEITVGVLREKLATPSLRLEGTTLYWDEVENAVKYVVSVNGGEGQEYGLEICTQGITVSTFNEYRVWAIADENSEHYIQSDAAYYFVTGKADG